MSRFTAIVLGITARKEIQRSEAVSETPLQYLQCYSMGPSPTLSVGSLTASCSFLISLREMPGKTYEHSRTEVH